MLKTLFVRLLVAVACLTALAGCGEGDSETRGTITVSATRSALTTGLYLIEVQGFYFNGEGVAIGVPIDISATVETPDGTVVDQRSVRLRSDSAGTVSYDLEVQQGAVDTVVRITASTGGLSDTTRVVVPALSPITSTPGAVTFAPDAASGAFQSLFLAGGIAPYSAVVDSAHAADLTATVNGSELIITKRNPSVATGPVNNATVTVTGGNAGLAPLTIGVSYQ